MLALSSVVLRSCRTWSLGAVVVLEIAHPPSVPNSGLKWLTAEMVDGI